MLFTIAVIFVVLASFLLIMGNMYSDYAARKEQDARLIANKARNIISECEELLLNQSQLVMSKTLVLVLHYRIIRALRKRAIDKKSQDEVKERIANEEKIIADLKNKYQESNVFKAPENDLQAITQLRTIRRLRNILKSELSFGVPLNPALINKEDRRLYILVLKVNISNLVQKVFEMKRQKQFGSCRQLIEKGLQVIKLAGVKDGWFTEKEDILTGLLANVNSDANPKSKEKKASEEADANGQSTANKDDYDEIFGDKKKW